jgi:hypothetical protein
MQQRLEVATPVDQLIELLRDPQQLVAIEPRLIAARWVDAGAPRPGSRAVIVTDIPYTVPLVARLIGSPRGQVTITRWEPPRHLACRFVTAAGDGHVDLRTRDAIVEVDGLFRPVSPLARRLLRPFRGRLERLASRAIARGTRRIEAALAGADRTAVPH